MRRCNLSVTAGTPFTYRYDRLEMSLLSIFAPTATDQEYCAQLINGISVRSAEDSSFRLQQLLETSDQITRKDLLPALQKILAFLETDNVEAAAKVVSALAYSPQKLLKEGDLAEIMEIVIHKPSLQSAVFVVPFLGVCEKALTSGREIAKDVMDLVPFASFAGDPMVTSFLVRVAQLVPELRVPFVFAGLIEQIMPTIGTNEIHLALLASLIKDPQSRQYFADMDHIPQLVSVLFDLNISALATSAFRSLLDPEDLIHLNDLQDRLFALGTPRQLVVSLTLQDSSDETVKNAALCIGDCIQYRTMTELPFSVDALLKLMIQRPAVIPHILYIFENLAISSPALFPLDSVFLDKPIYPRDPCVTLYLSYLAYDCHRRSSLDIADFVGVKGHALSLLMAIGVQRKLYLDGADIIAQTPEDEMRRQLASINCFVTGHGGPRAALVHHSSLFFLRNARRTNPYFSGSAGSPEFFPQSFLAWGSTLFSPVNRGRLIQVTGTWGMTPPAEQVDISPDESHANLMLLNSKANDVIRDNDLWKARYETLETRHSALMKDYSHLEMELIESRCQQLIMRSEKTE